MMNGSRGEKKRPKDLYVTVETHRQVKMDAAWYGVEMGEITEAALAAWQDLDESTQHKWLQEIGAAD